MKSVKYGPDFTKYNTGKKKVKLYHVHYIGGGNSGETQREISTPAEYRWINNPDLDSVHSYKRETVKDKGTYIEVVYFLCDVLTMAPPTHFINLN